MSQAQLSKLSDLRINPDQRRASRPWRKVFAVVAMLGLAGVLFVLGSAGLGRGPISGGSVLASFSPLGQPEVSTTRVVLRKDGGPVVGGGVLTATGYVVARQKASVAARNTGLLAAVLVDIGDVVKKGQELARLEQDREKVGLQAAQARLAWRAANLAEEKTELANARKALDRQKRLHQQGIATEQVMDDADARVSRSEAKIRALDAEMATQKIEVQAAEVELEYTYVRAPFDGTVLTKDAEVGEIVAPVSVGGLSARGSIVSVANLRELEVEVDVSEVYISRIRPDLPAQVVLDAYSDRSYRGSVRQIVPVANRQKAAVLVKVRILDPDARVLPEMGAKVTFLEEALPEVSAEHEPKSSLMVDARAVRKSGAGAYLFLVRDGRLESRSVEVGRQEGPEVELLKGAAEGDVVMLEGPPELQSGTAVRIKE